LFAKNKHIIVLLGFISIIFAPGIYAQDAKDSIFKQTNIQINKKDLTITKDVPDSLRTSKDSLSIIKTTDSTAKVTKKSGGLDTVVVYSAKDTVIFYIKSKTMHLRGNSKLLFRQQNLESEIIDMDFTKSNLRASGVRDSTNKLRGYPKFTDKGETFYGETIGYNFKSQQGNINMGETDMGEGYYFGEKIKRISESELFIKDGCYTTCDEPHPHYYFGSPEMKVIAKDKVFIDPIIFYLEDMPIFALPFGLFFSNQSGRRSGIIIPSFFFSATRGVTLENTGYYFAASDYWDTRLTGDYYSKGGFNIKNYTQWKYQDILNGNLDVQYGKTRFNPNQEYNTNWALRLSHQQQIHPLENLTANLAFSSQNFNQNTAYNINQRMQQEASSNASYSKSFDNNISINAAYSRSQDIINGTYTQSPSLNVSFPQINLLKKFVSSDNWLKDFYISGGASFAYTDRKYNVYPTHLLNDSIVTDTAFAHQNTTVISTNPSINIPLPKLSYFSFTPFINTGINGYFRKMKKYYDITDSTVKNTMQYGFYPEYNYNMGIRMSTRLFGMLNLGKIAFKHEVQPSISYSYTPDLSGDNIGFIGSYYNPLTKQNIKYSRFEADGSGIASRALSSSLSYSIVNTFKMKVPQNDTLDDKIFDLGSVTVSGGYDFAKTEQKASDINVGYHSTITSLNLNFGGSSTFTLYKEAKLFDTVSQQYNKFYSRTNQLLLNHGEGLARLTGFDISLSTGFSSEGGFNTPGTQNQTAQKKDSVGLGERFANRINYEDKPFDFFGDNTPGYSYFKMPWNVQLNFNYRYTSQYIDQETHSFTVSANFNLNITPTWSLTGFLLYDFVQKQLNAPTVSINKDLHCWVLNFTWYPVGYNRGFYLHFGIKAPQLRDLKYEERQNQYF